MQYFLSILFLGLLSCQTTLQHPTVNTNQVKNVPADSVPTWSQLLDHADWPKNYNFQMFSIRDTLWIFHSEGAWYSTDGVHWSKSALPNVIHNHAFLDYVFFKDAIYGLGYFNGNIEQSEFRPDIFISSDLKSWNTLSRQSNLPARFFYHPFVFANKIWIIGGEDRNTQYADIWNSEDGIHWVKQKDQLPFGKRSGSQVVLLNHTLYLLNNDVWRSEDGLNWQEVTKEIVPGESVFGYTAQVFDNQIWLLGCNRNGRFSSQVLSSADGKNWQMHTAPWLPRGGIAATVHRNKIYMTGGKYGGTSDHPDFRYDNDVWVFGRN